MTKTLKQFLTEAESPFPDHIYVTYRHATGKVLQGNKAKGDYDNHAVIFHNHVEPSGDSDTPTHYFEIHSNKGEVAQQALRAVLSKYKVHVSDIEGRVRFTKPGSGLGQSAHYSSLTAFLGASEEPDWRKAHD